MMGHRAFKDRLYGEFAVLGRALANPHRLELLDLLGQGERSVDALAQEAHLTLANASAHLQVLRRARLVDTEKRGLYVVYRLSSSGVYELWRTLRDLGASRLAEVDRLVETYLTDRGALDAISKEDLVQQIADGAVVVLDVRPVVEYEQGHVAGARSIPIDELERRLTELPRDQEIVAYCRGPYCVFSDEAVTLLVERGYRARRLTEGLPEWRAAGYPVEPVAAAS
jgi:rhodanese-related sulfurtransferase/DNA-binding transcriptional ArsR family regulator